MRYFIEVISINYAETLSLFREKVMKKIIVLMLIIVFVVFSVACEVAEEPTEDGYVNEENDYEDETEEPDDYEYEEYVYEDVYEDDPVIEIIHEPVIRDFYETLEFLPGFAVYYFDRLQAIWDEDDGEMWGVPLHAPLIIFCRDTNIAVASHPDEYGEFEEMYIDGTTVYVGEFSRTEISNLGLFVSMRNWDGQTGIFMSLHFMESPLTVAFQEFGYRGIQDSSIINTMVIIHYSVHAIQLDLIGVVGALTPTGGGREIMVSYMLEINALVSALVSENDADRLVAIRDALSIREARRDEFRTGANENELIVIEGAMPTYTELHLMWDRDEIVEILRQVPDMFLQMETRLQVAISYGYNAGVMYGMFLDDAGVDWRYGIRKNTDLGLLLKEALGITELLPLDEIDLERYRYSEIVAAVHG